MSHKRCCCTYGNACGYGGYAPFGNSGSWGTGFSGNNLWWILLLVFLANRNNN